MGLGKAQKQARNKAKIGIKKQKFLDDVRDMDDKKLYRIVDDNGEYLLSVCFLLGCQWKELILNK